MSNTPTTGFSTEAFSKKKLNLKQIANTSWTLVLYLLSVLVIAFLISCSVHISANPSPASFAEVYQNVLLWTALIQGCFLNLIRLQD